MRFSALEAPVEDHSGEGVPLAGFQVVNPCEIPNWEELVRAHDGHSVFHGTGWARVLQQTYGLKPFYFVLRDQAQPTVLFPLMEASSWLAGRRGVSLPFTDECRPLLSAGIEFSELLAELIRLGRKRHWRYIEWRGNPAAPGPAPSMTSSLQFHNHQLELSRGEEELFRGFSSSTRRAVRKAENSGMEIEISTSAGAIAAYYELHCRTRKKHGLPPQPFSFFENIQRFLLSAGGGFVVLARLPRQPSQGGLLVSGAVFLQAGKRAVFKFGASDERFQPLRGNNLVMWHGIKHLARNGCELLDFGRTSIGQEGLRRYKLGWGAEERVISYFHYDLRLGGFVKKKDRAAGLHTEIFKRLPLRVSAWMGKALYKHLA